MSAGMVPSFGYEYFFVVVPLTYSWTFLENAISGSPAQTFLASPRIGITTPIKSYGRIAGYVGATYLKNLNTLRSIVQFQVPGDTPAIGGKTIDIEYEVTARSIDPWNYLVGFNWNINSRLSLALEAAAGGSREQFICNAGLRF